jgi:FG-GAP-like repeat
MKHWQTFSCAAALGATVCLHTAGAQTAIPVAVTFPGNIDAAFSAVSYSPKYRVGAFYVGGSYGTVEGIATATSPSVLVAAIPRVSKIAAIGGTGRNSVFALAGFGSQAVFAHDVGTMGATQLSGTGFTDMWINRYDAQLMALDESPNFASAGSRRGARIRVWSTQTWDSIGGFNILKSINSFDYPLCPCAVAADPTSFRQIYAIARDSDTVTAHRINLGRNSSATGQIVVESRAGTFQGLSQIVADVDRAYVTDSGGRLHTVTPLGDEPFFQGEELQLTTALTDIVIQGTLVRDTAPFSRYFYDFVANRNVPQNSPSEIKVYSGTRLVATIPTSTQMIAGNVAFTSSEIFFWDGPTLKAIRKGSWKVRVLPNVPTGREGSLLYYDYFDNLLYLSGVGLPSNVVTTIDAGVPAPVVANDLSGDSRSDIVFKDATSAVGAMIVNGVTVTGSANILPGGSGWSVTHIADFDGDGKADLLIKNIDGRIAILLMDGTNVLSFTELVGAGAGYTSVLTADFDRDGRADIVLKNTDGSTALLLMNGAAVSSASFLLTAGSPWNVTHAGDFNADGQADLVLRNTDGSTALLVMNGTNVVNAALLLGAGSPWTVAHVADLSGDNKSDIIIKNTDGSAATLLMNGTAVAAASFLLTPGSPWTVTHIGDFNGDGKADLLIRNTDGSVVILQMNGTAIAAASFLLGAGSASTVAQIADYNGDGKSDILLRNADGSATAVLMNGAVVTSAGNVWGPGTLVAVP